MIPCEDARRRPSRSRVTRAVPESVLDLRPGAVACIPFDAPPGVEIPDAFVLPASDGTPHPLAAAALAGLVLRLRNDPSPAGFDLDGPDGGKMFGVLVVRTSAGDLGVFRAFSGRLGRAWLVEGFVPPVFDMAEIDSFWPAGEAEIDGMTDAIATLEGTARIELTARRRLRSRALWQQFVAAYRITNPRGDIRPLSELFAPRITPGGAGDCAAPKLLTAAFAVGARPLALAEIWWGATVGPRTQGTMWPPCADKCGPILDHMLS